MVSRRTRRRRLSARQRERWFFIRYDTLVLEGFTPEEANLMGRVRISTTPMRRVRRQRKRMVQRTIDRGFERREAIEIVRARIREEEEEMLDWTDFINTVYPATLVG